MTHQFDLQELATASPYGLLKQLREQDPVHFSPALKGWVLPRNSAWHASARCASVVISQDLGRVATGPIKQIPGSIPSAVGLAAGTKPLVRDEQVTQGLDAGRFRALARLEPLRFSPRLTYACTIKKVIP